MEKYATLVRHYRRRFEEYGHDPAKAVVGAGAGGLFVARTSQEAVETYRPYYDAFANTPAARHNKSPFTSLEDNIERGPALIGSPAQVLEKIHRYHEAFGHEVLGIGVDGHGLPESTHRASLELFFAEVAPALRRELPSRVWNGEASVPLVAAA